MFWLALGRPETKTMPWLSALLLVISGRPELGELERQRGGAARSGARARPGPKAFGRLCSRKFKGTGRVLGWFDAHRPACHQFELGAWAGLFFPSRRHVFFAEGFTPEPLVVASGSFGVQGSYAPLPELGVELGAGVIPTQTDATRLHTMMYTTRATVLLQAPLRLTPVALAGVVILSSSGPSLGAAVTAGAHLGLGLKLYATDGLALRLELRDTVTEGTGARLAHHPELLLGVTVVLQRFAP